MSNEKHEVFSREEIILQDGTEVELKPLVIGKKRKFMRMWSDHITAVNETLREAQKKAQAAEEEGAEPFVFDENGMNERQYDMYIKLCAMCLEEYKDGRTDKQFTAYLEDTLDEPTIFKILDVCGSLKLGDSPN